VKCQGSHVFQTISSQAAVWLSVLCTGHALPSPQEDFLVFTPVWDWVNPMDELAKLRKLNYLIGDWFCNLPACNIVLYPTMLRRVPGIFVGVRGVKCGILYVSHPPGLRGLVHEQHLLSVYLQCIHEHQFKVVHTELSSTQTCKTTRVIIGTVYPCAVAHRIWGSAGRAEYTLRWSEDNSWIPDECLAHTIACQVPHKELLLYMYHMW
jgi:hypothetical protein